MRNFVTYIFTLKACISLKAMRRGQEIHNEIIEREFDSDPCLVAILVDAYAKCGIFEDATAVIGLLPDANTLVSLLKDCGSVVVVDKGIEIHNEIVRLLEDNIEVGNALVPMQ